MRWCARRLVFWAPTPDAIQSGHHAASTSPTRTSAAFPCSRKRNTAASLPRTRCSLHSIGADADDGSHPRMDQPSFFPPVPFPRLAPFIRSTAAVLYRQNRIRGILAATAALALLLSPYRSDRALVSALAGLTGYVAFVGVSTLWIVRRQRAGIPLMSVHGIADVTLMFIVAQALPIGAES